MSKELNKLIANALSKHSSKSVEIAAKSKPFIGKVKDMHYFINVDGINNNFVSEPFGRQIDSLKKIEAFKKSAKSTHISIKRTPIAKAFKEFKDLYKPIEFFGATKINDSFKDDSFKIWYTTSEEVASIEIAAPNKPKSKGPGKLGNVKTKETFKRSKEELTASINKDAVEAERLLIKVIDSLTSCINLVRNPTASSIEKAQKKIETAAEYLANDVRNKKSIMNYVINISDDFFEIKNLKKK